MTRIPGHFGGDRDRSVRHPHRPARRLLGPEGLALLMIGTLLTGIVGCSGDTAVDGSPPVTASTYANSPGTGPGTGPGTTPGAVASAAAGAGANRTGAEPVTTRTPGVDAATLGGHSSSTPTISAQPEPRTIYYDLTRFDWYRQGEALIFEGRSYQPGGVQATGEREFDRRGEFEGVDIYLPRGAAEPYDTIYVPVYWGYWLAFTSRGE